MAEEQTPPPRKTLGDYVMYQGPKHISSIAIPATANALEIELDFLLSSVPFNLHQWIMRIHNPYSYLDTFY